MEKVGTRAGGDGPLGLLIETPTAFVTNILGSQIISCICPSKTFDILDREGEPMVLEGNILKIG